MSCAEARRRFSGLVDDELDRETQASVEMHVHDCPTCAEELRALRATVALLHAVAPARAPAGFVDRVTATVHPVPRWRRALRGLVVPLPVKLPLHAAAAVLLAVGVGYLLQRTPELRDAAHGHAPVSRENDIRPPGPAGPPPEQGAEQAQRALETRSRVSEDARRDEATERTLASERTLAKAESPSVAARSVPAPGAAGELGVASRDTARRGLQELATRHGGRVLAERRTDTAEVIAVRVPREQYEAFVRGLTTLGRWRPTRDAGADAVTIEVTIRLVD